MTHFPVVTVNPLGGQLNVSCIYFSVN